MLSAISDSDEGGKRDGNPYKQAPVKTAPSPRKVYMCKEEVKGTCLVGGLTGEIRDRKHMGKPHCLFGLYSVHGPHGAVCYSLYTSLWAVSTYSFSPFHLSFTRVLLEQGE